jgi:endo-1,4-beta-xylanase
MARLLALTATTLLLSVACASPATHHSAPAAPALPTLRQVAAGSGVRIGTAVTASTLIGNARYGATAAREFDALTPGSEMKWALIEPARGRYDWGAADATVAFAAAHHQAVRGHTLLWQEQIPDWLANGGFGAPELSAIVRQHIEKEVGRYRGRIASWDVVNEPLDDGGGLRSDLFSRAMGPAYIADALTQAHAADPHARLYVNDFDIEGVNAKSTAMLNLVTSLRKQGVPIDGVGIQTHLALGHVPADFAQNIARFAAAGFDVWLTEIDVRIPLPPTPGALARQASDYTTIVNDCLVVTRCVGVSVWGFTDLDSWIPATFPGQGSADLFDADIKPKPAYGAVLAALRGRGRTLAAP